MNEYSLAKVQQLSLSACKITHFLAYILTFAKKNS